VAGEQIAQAVLQEFATRANSDAHIAEIFKQAQALGQRSQPLVPAR